MTIWKFLIGNKLAAFLIALLISLVSMLTINSCRKMDDAGRKPAEDFNVAAAKEWWYGEFRKGDEFKNWKTNYSVIKGRKSPDWKRGIYLKIGNTEIVELPLIYEIKIVPNAKDIGSSEWDKKSIASASLDRLVIIRTSGGLIETRIVQYVPTIDYLKKRNYDISGNKVTQFDPDFSGNMYVKKWNEQLVKGYKLENGKLIKRIKAKDKSTSIASRWDCETVWYDIYRQDCEWTQEGDQPATEVCGEWYLFETQPVEECTYVPDEEPGEDDPCFNLSAAECMCDLFGLYCDGPPGGSGGGGGVSLPPVYISVQHPCLKAAIQDVMGTTYPSAANADDLSVLFSYLFASIYTSPTSYGTLNVIQTSGATQHPAWVDPPNSPGLYTIHINPYWYNGQLISGVPAHPTKEYWASEFIHEVVHTFMMEYNFDDAFISDGLAQHQQMIQYWITHMAQVLENMYNMSSTDATALALAGLGDVLQQGSIASQTQWDTFIFQNYNLHVTDVITIRNDYLTGVKGTINCP